MEREAEAICAQKSNWHTIKEDDASGPQPHRVMGELLLAAFKEALPSLHPSVPPIRFDAEACNVSGLLQTQQWRVKVVSIESMQHPAFGGDGAHRQWLLCEAPGSDCQLRPLPLPDLRKIASLFAVDYLLWNYNRFRFKNPAKAAKTHRPQRYTQNVFLQLGAVAHAAPGPALANGLALLDNEFASHLDDLASDKDLRGWLKLHNQVNHVCKAFPSYAAHASFSAYVWSSAGYTPTADAATGCPLEPALVADLHRHGSGRAFAASVLSATSTAGSACMQHLWNHTFSSKECPTLSSYLAARYDSLVVGLQAWGCPMPIVVRDAAGQYSPKPEQPGGKDKAD